MLRLLACLACLLTATPAIAQVDPYDRDWRDDHWRDDYRDYSGGVWRERERGLWRGRHGTWQRHDRYPARWYALDGYTNAREGSTYVRLPPHATLSRIRIEGAHGVPVITTVEIHYRRHVQRATVNRRLLRGQGVDIPTDPRRAIEAVVVHTDPRYRGGFSVWGGD